MKKQGHEKIGDHMVGSSNTSTCSTIADEMLRNAPVARLDSETADQVKAHDKESTEA